MEELLKVGGRGILAVRASSFVGGSEPQVIGFDDHEIALPEGSWDNGNTYTVAQDGLYYVSINFVAEKAAGQTRDDTYIRLVAAGSRRCMAMSGADRTIIERTREATGISTVISLKQNDAVQFELEVESGGNIRVLNVYCTIVQL